MRRLTQLSVTGRTKRLVSPLTGQIGTYHETYHIQVSAGLTQPPDVIALRSRINNDLLAQQVDGLCDSILIVQGVVQTTYKPRVWIAEEQPSLKLTLGKERLIAQIIIIAICLMIAVVAVAIAAVLITYMLTNSFTTIAQIIMQPPQYVGGPPDDPQVYGSFAEYLSAQFLYYWYVCPSCGAGFGLKTQYPNIEDVPQAEVDAFNEHRAVCLGIPKGPQNVVEFLVFAAIVVGGVVVVIWFVSGLGKEATKIIVPMIEKAK